MTVLDIDQNYRYVIVKHPTSDTSNLVVSDPQKRGIHFIPACPLSVDQIGLEAKTTPRFDEWHQFASDIREQRTNLVKAELVQRHHPNLYHHQNIGVEFIHQTHQRALVWDDPRVGKTPQAIVSLFGSHTYEANYPALIVCKKSNASDWKRELQIWSQCTVINLCGIPNDLKVVNILDNLHKERVVFIINWQALEVVHKHLKAGTFPATIVDEAHILKNRKSGIHTAVKRLSSDKLLLLTATPIEKPEELYAYAHLLYPRQFTSYWRWVQWFCHWNDGHFGREINGPIEAATPIMHDLISPFTIRRKIGDVVEAENIGFNVHAIRCPASDSDDQDQLDYWYRRFEKEPYIEEFDLELSSTMTRRYRQIELMSNPDAFNLDIKSPKLEHLETLLMDGKQRVVFCSLRSTAEYLHRMLSSSSIFIGGRGGDNDFVNGDTQVLITTPQMAGEGKDYSFAESVVMYELPLSARRLIQCMSRTIKLGVTTVANVDVLIASPLEQNIFELLERKKLHIEEVELNESFK